MIPTYLMPSPTVSFIGSLVMGCLSAYFAKGRGKNPYLWFGIGLILGLPGFVCVFLIPTKKKRPVRQPHPEEHVITLDITPVTPPTCKEKLWYYLDAHNQQKGPMSYEALKHAYLDTHITPSTYVWNEEFDNWKTFGDVFTIPSTPDRYPEV